MSQNAVSGAPERFEIRFRPGLGPGPHWGSSQLSPYLLAALSGPCTCKSKSVLGKEMDRRRRAQGVSARGPK